MQQRPGDTQIGLEPKALKLLRSTKAGALAPATRSLARPLRSLAASLNKGRSVSSGDTTAAGHPRHDDRPLNEGRSVSSGDTAGHSGAIRIADVAQRRPER